MLAAGSSAATADETAIPQAPVLSVVPSTVTLPFTIDGGGDIEVAVLTGGTDPSTATWQVRTDLPLAPYLDTDIRVLARKAGVTDPAQTFDATYQVRSAYPASAGQTIANNPSVAVPGNDPRIRGWATGWVDPVPYGTDVADSWKTPQNAIGPVGGTGYEGNTSVVVLGNNGQITMTFGSPIVDGPGYDLAVFENGFQPGANVFAEIGRVEVSSNGTDFVAFDTGTTWTTPTGGFGTIPPSAYGGGIVGRDLNGYGTPVDLTALKNKPAVRNGTVDLQNITHVKIVDIVGNGTPKDSFGNGLFDPTPTVGSGGFDLRGVGVLNQKAASVTLPTVAGSSPSQVTIGGVASTGQAGAQTVRVEVGAQADHSDATSRGEVSVAAGGGTTPVSFTVGSLTPASVYHYRFVSRSADGTESASTWRTFTKTKATVSSPQTPTLTRNPDSNNLVATVRANVHPQTDGAQSVTVESSPYADYSGATTSAATVVPGTNASTAVSVALPAQGPGTSRWYRFVSTSGDGTRVEGAWTQVVANQTATVTSPSVPFRFPGGVVYRSTVSPGTSGAQTVVIERATNSQFTANLVTSAPIVVPAAEVSRVIDHKVTGLTDGTTYYFRTKATGPDAVTVTGSTSGGAAGGTAPTQTVTVGDVAATTATIDLNLQLGTHGPRTGAVQISQQADHADATTAEALDLTAARTTPANLTGLTAGTTYWVRVVTTGTVSELSAETAWVEFTTLSALDAIGTTEITETGYVRAQASVEVSPGSLDRTVGVEYRTVGGDTVATPTRVVPAGDDSTEEFELSGLTAGTGYEWRVVTTSLGVTEATDWAAFSTSTPAADACEGDEGVTVVVDYGALAAEGADDVVVGCAPGEQASGITALQTAGNTLGWVPGYENAAICTINFVPAAGYPTCWFDGYWSYWHAEPGQAWTYSQLGAGNRTPALGSVEGWRYVSLADPSTPPSLGPTFAAGVDVTAPVVTIVDSVFDGDDVTVEYDVDDAAATVECRVDTADWAPCDAPAGWSETFEHVFAALTPGAHSLQIRATDPWGNASVGSVDVTIDAAAPTFPDVATDFLFYGDIEWLVANGITEGYADGAYRPGNTVNRGSMAAFLYRLAAEDDFTPQAEPTFPDVPTDHLFYTEIEWLADQGITEGYADGFYRPGNTVNRGSMAAFLYRTAGSPDVEKPADATFPDVPAGHLFDDEVEWLVDTGITEGYADGFYRPGNTVNRGSMAAFLHRLADWASEQE